MPPITWHLFLVLLLASSLSIAAGQCPDGQPIVQCFVAPCDVSSCPRHPTANCSDDYCGGCNAVWTLDGTEVTSDCHKESADVRLIHGNNISHGIVEVWQDNQWQTLCAWPQFLPQDALVVCKQLGFSKGTVLPMAAYGRHTGNHTHPFKGCSGGEIKIQDCKFDENYTPNVCATQDVHYASVSCFDKQEDEGLHLSPVLSDTNVSSPSSGKVELFLQQAFGQICSTYFTEKEANVTCRQLGFSGGVPMVYGAAETLPFLLTGLHCSGDEDKISDCYKETQICYSNQRAGVLCYNTTGVRFSLADNQARGGGIVVLSVDGKEGTICGDGWSNLDAQVFCRQIGYVTGLFYTGKSSESSRDVYLSNVNCLGVEDSVIACEGSGWRNVNQSLCNHENDAGVYCYKSARITLGYRRENVTMGIVEVYQKYFWTTLCADGFDQRDADVICRQLGYLSARVLLPGQFGRPLRYVHTVNINCTGNETDILDCEHEMGFCSSFNYASVLCSHQDASPNTTVSIEQHDSGRVLVSQFGINGTVCRSGWDSTAASVLCQENGFRGGVVYSSSDELTRYEPIWVSSIKCQGQEKSIKDCVFNYSVPRECGNDLSSAGVLCYMDSGMGIRLADGIKANQGRVEVSRDGVWGTVCHGRWSTSDAVVVCRQLLYASGVSYRGSYHGPGTGPILMDKVSCSGYEHSIYQCPNLGWNVSSDSCKDHSQDAGVYCMPWVKLNHPSYGIVRVWKKNNYGMVCADGFDENAARVVCKEFGYRYSIEVCCMGLEPEPTDMEFAMSDVNCDGTESGLRACRNEYADPNCSTDNYASVFCTNTDPANSAIHVTLSHYNVVQISYVYQPGLLSASEFTDMDATVICRENNAKFQSGLALRHLRPTFHSHNIYWLRNASCVGTEARIGDCPNAGRVGKLGRFDDKVAAAVACFDTKDPQTPQLKLSYGNRLNEGHVEVNVRGTWGSLCAGNLTEAEARMICRLHGYRDGVALHGGSFGQNFPAGYSTMDYIKCSGDEQRLLDCVVSLVPDQVVCPRNMMSAVKCYETVRLTGSSMVNYGRLELWSDDGWYSVCDENFDDTDATVVCKALGYTAGLSQCCSALGTNGTAIQTLLTDVACTGTESSPQLCPFTKGGTCRSRKYASVLCLSTNTATEDLTIHLDDFYGPVVASRYGLQGYVCKHQFDNSDASLVCKTKGFQKGYAVNVYRDYTYPVVLGNLTCNGVNEIESCTYSNFSGDHGCADSDIIAGVVCSDSGSILFKLEGRDDSSGIPKLIVGSNTLYLDDTYFDDSAVNLFCLSAGFAGGSKLSQSRSVSSVHHVVTDIRCAPDAPSITHCDGHWNPKNSKSIPIHEISCFQQVRLQNGGAFFGAVEVYYSNMWGTICSKSFGQNEADLVCSIIGFDQSLPICCSPFGALPNKQLFKDFRCSGSEDNILRCPHTFQSYGVQCSSSLEYASVLCYNGDRKSDYTIKINGGKYYGDVIVNYMGVNGRICRDGWDDKDAQVVCRQNNYIRGFAYSHYVEEGKQSSGPYWISNVQCQGHEKSLQECQHTPAGSVNECSSFHYAGVFCFDDQGIYYRISGGDPSGRSGRAEIYFNDNWGTLCNTDWGEEEAAALCRQMGFHGGDPIEGPYKVPAKGLVYKASYQCSEGSGTLDDCPHSGWQEVVDGECTEHRNDAGVFCYQNVRIYNGIGRSQSSGPVLIFRDKDWYLLCDDGFTDHAATLVCQELGFPYGYASCCSADGPLSVPIWMNHTLDCSSGNHVEECLHEKICARRSYATVSCSYQPKTTVDTSPRPDSPSPVKQEDNKAVVAVVSSIAACLLIIVIVIIVMKCRKSYSKKSQEKTHGEFREGVLNKSLDGSIHVHNPMHDLCESDDVTIQHDSVQYHPTGFNNDQGLAYTNHSYAGFNSILYSSDCNGKVDDETNEDHVIEHDDTKPLGVKPDFKDSSYAAMEPNFSSSGLQECDNQQNTKQSVRVTIENTPKGYPKNHFMRSLSECKEISLPEDT